MADFLEEKRQEIQARLKELKPLVDEYHLLEAAEILLGPETDERLGLTNERRTRAATPMARHG